MNKPITSMIIFVLLLTTALASDSLDQLLPPIQEVIQKSINNIWQEKSVDEPLWSLPTSLGTHYLSEYYFVLKALNFYNDQSFTSRFNTTYFTRKLLRQQHADGSWHQVTDLNRKEGSLDVTIFNYWYLRQIGLDSNQFVMVKARQFIENHGGIQHSSGKTRFYLSLFGQREWDGFAYPLFFFKKAFPLYSFGYLKDFSPQWVYPHAIGMSYLKYHKSIFLVGSACLTELRPQEKDIPCLNKNRSSVMSGFNRLSGNSLLQRDPDVDNVLAEAIKLKGKKALIGSYTTSTLLSLLAFRDYYLRYDDKNNQLIEFYLETVNKSLSYIEQKYINQKYPYQGYINDGKYWDSLLASIALLQAGQSPEKIKPTLDYLLENALSPEGGISYGQNFENTPDLDDTSMLLNLLGRLSNFYNGTQDAIKYRAHIEKIGNWIRTMQNADGGFAAFDQGKTQDTFTLFTVLDILTNGKIRKGAEIFDPSCPDIVGHLFEGMGDADIFDAEVFSRGIEYLFNARNDGMWTARWGINYVYAVGAVFPGLARIGYDMREEWVANVTRRLMAVQQSDGGFGEDQESYNRKRYVEGVTTASMTAWGLLAYLEVAHTADLDARMARAAEYLIRNFNENGGRFFDRSVVGTGHRGALYIQYPMYPLVFPLIALSRLREYVLQKVEQPSINELLQKLRQQKQIQRGDKDL